MNEEFQTLKLDYQTFTLQNKKNVAQHILLSDGGIVQINPQGTAIIESKYISQLPDLQIFRLIEPTLEQLISYGVLKPKTVTSPENDAPVSQELINNPGEGVPNTPSSVTADKGSSGEKQVVKTDTLKK